MPAGCPTRRRHPGWHPGWHHGLDRGAAVVEFVLVAGLLVFLFLGVVQVALLFHARDVLVSDAEEGARYAANQGVAMTAGERRCERFIAASLSRALLRPGGCTGTVETVDGLREIQMSVRALVPFTVLPLGGVHLYVVGHALAEP